MNYCKARYYTALASTSTCAKRQNRLGGRPPREPYIYSKGRVPRALTCIRPKACTIVAEGIALGTGTRTFVALKGQSIFNPLSSIIASIDAALPRSYLI